MSLLQALEKHLYDAEIAYREANRMVEAGTLSSSRYYRNVRDYWWARYRKAKEPVRAIITSTGTSHV